MIMNKILPQNIPERRGFRFLFFVIALFAVFFGLQQDKYLPLRPQSIHIWRQTDCLSITQNYYQNGNSFCDPEIYNQISDEGLSGKSAGEFPVLYYTVAQLWKVFGKHEWIYRAFVFLIFAIGCWALYEITFQLTKNYWMSVFISLLLLTSPTIATYSISFLPNIPALAFALVAWLFVYYFYRNKKELYLWFSMLFFSLAILLKVTAGISFVALGGWWFIESVWGKKEGKLFPKGFKHFWPFLGAVIPVVAWYWYAAYFNDIHHGKYTFNSLWPIWEASREKILNTFDAVDKIWLKEYFHPSLLIITGILWIFMLAQPKKLKPFFYYLLVIFPIGMVMYLLFWFQALDSHDYYLINILFLIVSVWAIFIFTFQDKKWLRNKIVSILLMTYFVFLVVHCQQRLNDRFHGWMNDWYTTKLKAVGELEPVLDRLGVEPDAKVISIPDYTINATLYYMNREGYTDFGSDFSKKETFEKRIEQGAKYLIVNDSTILSKPVIALFTQHEIGKYKNVSIYKLGD